VRSAQPDPDPDFADAGIDAWRALQAVLSEPLQSFLAPEPLRLLDELRSDETPHQRREEIGLRLNQMGDPRRGVGVDAAGLPDLVWVDIPAGQVTLETEPPETFAVATFRSPSTRSPGGNIALSSMPPMAIAIRAGGTGSSTKISRAPKAGVLPTTRR
jgi:hypothetical protein